MAHQPLIARIMTGGWISPVAIAINGDLLYFRKLLIKEFGSNIPIDYCQANIVVTDKEDPYNHAAAASITAREIDINDEKNWVFENHKILLRTGKTCNNMDTYFVLVDHSNCFFLTQEIISKAITSAINQYGEEE